MKAPETQAARAKYVLTMATRCRVGLSLTGPELKEGQNTQRNIVPVSDGEIRREFNNDFHTKFEKIFICFVSSVKNRISSE